MAAESAAAVPPPGVGESEANESRKSFMDCCSIIIAEASNHLSFLACCNIIIACKKASKKTRRKTIKSHNHSHHSGCSAGVGFGCMVELDSAAWCFECAIGRV